MQRQSRRTCAAGWLQRYLQELGCGGEGSGTTRAVRSKIAMKRKKEGQLLENGRWLGGYGTGGLIEFRGGIDFEHMRDRKV